MDSFIGLFFAIVLSTMLFLGSSFQLANNMKIENVKQNINLAAKVLVGSAEQRNTNIDNIGTGYDLEGDIEIEVDRARLLRDFDQALRNNYKRAEDYQKAKAHIPIKILVMYDRFYVADWDDVWSEAYYFQYREGNRTYFLNTRNSKAYYLASGGEPIYVNIDPKIRDQVVIDRVNQMVSAYTDSYFTTVGAELSGDSILRHTDNQLNIEIQNPSTTDPANVSNMAPEEITAFFTEKYRQSNFNVLDGITFFVVHLEEKYFGLRAEEIIYQNYNVAGYTLEAQRKTKE